MSGRAGGLPEDRQILFTEVHLAISRLILDGLCVHHIPPCAVLSLRVSGPRCREGAEHVSQAGVCLCGGGAGGGCGAAGLAQGVCHTGAERLCPTWAACPEIYLRLRKGWLTPEGSGLRRLRSSMCRKSLGKFYFFPGEMCNYVRKRECVQHTALLLLVHPRCFMSVSRCVRAAEPRDVGRAQGFAWARAHPRRRCRGVVPSRPQRGGGRVGKGHVPSAQWGGRPRPLVDARGCPRGREQPSRAVRACVGSAAPLPQLRFSRRGHSGARPLGGLGGSLPSGLGGREKEIEKKQQPPASPFLSSRFAPPCSFSLPPSPLSSPLSPPSLFLIPATSSEPHSAAAAGGV